MSCESHVPRFVMLVFHNKDGVEPEHICYGKVLKNLSNFVREPVKTIWRIPPPQKRAKIGIFGQKLLFLEDFFLRRIGAWG